MLNYPVTLTKKDGDILSVLFRDLPDVCAEGSTVDTALDAARGRLELELMRRIRARESIPVPSAPHVRDRFVALDPEKAVKVLLWNEAMKAGRRKTDIARLFGRPPGQVLHMFDLCNSTPLSALVNLAATLGMRLSVTLH